MARSTVTQRDDTPREPRRIVVKIGSAVLARDGVLEGRAVERLAADISAVLDADARRRIVIVSSGAVASGFRALGLDKPPRRIVGKQAAAAVGQPRLMRAWSEAFAKASPARSPRHAAQVLLTAEDIDHRTRFLNARRTLEALLDAGVVPVVNENDSVSFAEIKLGDNDHLSALVASLVGADLLVILSSVPGVLDLADRARQNGAAHHAVVSEIRSLAEGLRFVRTSKTDVGTGGMATKVKAACMAAGFGTDVVIADGSLPEIVGRIIAGEAIGTRFPGRTAARATPARGVVLPRTGARKAWLGFSARPKGVLVVDDGARRALIERGASLLPSGIRRVEGEFAAGSLVELRDGAAEVFARGLACYSASELRAIAGKKASEIASILGYHYADEAVHRDDLAVLGGAA